MLQIFPRVSREATGDPYVGQQCPMKLVIWGSTFKNAWMNEIQLRNIATITLQVCIALNSSQSLFCHSVALFTLSSVRPCARSFFFYQTNLRVSFLTDSKLVSKPKHIFSFLSFRCYKKTMNKVTSERKELF